MKGSLTQGQVDTLVSLTDKGLKQAFLNHKDKLEDVPNDEFSSAAMNIIYKEYCRRDSIGDADFDWEGVEDAIASYSIISDLEEKYKIARGEKIETNKSAGAEESKGAEMSIAGTKGSLLASEPQKDDGAFKNVNVGINYSGTKIVLPDDPRPMSTTEAIDHLKRHAAQDEMEVGIHEEINCFPLEGAYALTKVLEKRFGWVNTETKKTMFGDIPPVMVTLEVGYKQTAQVFWGEFSVPGVKGRLATGVQETRQGYRFVISGTVKKKHQAEIMEIANDVRNFVASNSLYKGKAVRINTFENPKTGAMMVDLNSPPTFMDVSGVNENELTFSQEVQYQVQTSLWTPIEKTAECRKYGVPLKRGILLEGKYGTGKTLAAFVTAKKAVENNWTFIYLDRVSALKDVLLFARQFAPAVVFAEDIERVVSGGRSVKVDDVLNNIDGLDSKNQELICIFTTNHVEKLEPAMLRPGRLDAVITVSPPDKEAAEKLIRIYSKGLIAESEDLTGAGKELEGQIPATIREVVERSKLYAIGRVKEGEKLSLTGEDIRRAAVGIKSHIALMNPPEQTKDVTLADIIATVVKATERMDETDWKDVNVLVKKKLDGTVSAQVQ